VKDHSKVPCSRSPGYTVISNVARSAGVSMSYGRRGLEDMPTRADGVIRKREHVWRLVRAWHPIFHFIPIFRRLFFHPSFVLSTSFITTFATASAASGRPMALAAAAMGVRIYAFFINHYSAGTSLSAFCLASRKSSISTAAPPSTSTFAFNRWC
jgi:hypothetical protein